MHISERIIVREKAWLIMETLYTIGHSNYEIEKFIELLKFNDINVVVDVRSVPYSQYTIQFNRELLSTALKENGIAYVFMGKEFGARREDRTLYDEDGKLNFKKTMHSELFQSGVKRIQHGLEKGYRIAFMCAEKIPHECHRCIMVGKAFHDLGYDVKNITEDGSIISQEDIGKILLEMFFPDRNQITIFTMDEDKSDADYIEEAYQMREKQIAYNINNERQ